MEDLSYITYIVDDGLKARMEYCMLEVEIT